MPRKPHAVDHRDAALIANAHHFNAMAFIGRGQYDRIDDLPTLEAAKQAAAQIEARNPGRRAMIYGVSAEGRSAIVTPDLEMLIMETSVIGKSYTAKSAAIRALKRSGLEPDQAEVRMEGKAWVIRHPSTPAMTDAPRAAPPAAAKEPGKRKSVLRGQEDARAQAAAAKPQPKARALPQPGPSARLGPKARPAQQAKAARPATEPKPAKPRRNAAYEAALADAQKGKLPAAPDFSAATHAPYRGKLARVTELANAGDAAALQAETASWKPYNSSMIPLLRYRDLCVAALAAQSTR